MESAKILPVFCFLDEYGIILGGQTKFFALGAIVHPWPDDLVEKLHSVFEELVSACKKHRTAQEFHFCDVTLGTVGIYEKFLDVLTSDNDWRFFSVVIDLTDPKLKKPSDSRDAWAFYLRWSKLMLQKNLRANEKATLIADFFRRPRGATHKFATLPSVVPQLWDVIQTESHGVLLVQMADLVLGASMYSGTCEAKRSLAKKITEIRSGLPKSRFNEWRVKWD